MKNDAEAFLREKHFNIENVKNEIIRRRRGGAHLTGGMEGAAPGARAEMEAVRRSVREGGVRRMTELRRRHPRAARMMPESFASWWMPRGSRWPSRRPVIVLIYGPAGSGKTRAAERWAAAATGGGPVYRGECTRRHFWAAYSGERAAVIEGVDGSTCRSADLRRWLEHANPQVRALDGSYASLRCDYIALTSDRHYRQWFLTPAGNVPRAERFTEGALDWRITHVVRCGPEPGAYRFERGDPAELEPRGDDGGEQQGRE